jgi:hypothetical protein
MNRRGASAHHCNARCPQDLGSLPFDEEDGGAIRDVVGNGEVGVFDGKDPGVAAQNL